MAAAVVKRNLSEAIRHEMSARKISIAGLAKATRTSRNVIKRVLDQNNTSITLNTMAKTAEALDLEISLSTRRMSPEVLTDLTQQMVDAPTEAAAKALEDRIVAGFYGKKGPHAETVTV